MTGLPTTLVDFGTAINMLAQSQMDVTELVTKFDQLVNTTTPMTVKIDLTSGPVYVDNLAKIREDLQNSIGYNNPTVRSMTVSSSDGKQKNYVSSRDMSARALLVPNGSFNDKDTGFAGFSVGIRNTMRTLVVAEETEANVSMIDLPEVLVAGVRWDENAPAHSALKINIQPFSGSPDKFISDRMYYTTMTVVNQSASNFTVTIADKFGTSVRVDVIPTKGNVQYLFFSYPNKDTPNVVVLNKFGGV